MKPAGACAAQHRVPFGVGERRELRAAEQKEPTRQASELLDRQGNGYVVGSGGSYAAAMYLAKLTGAPTPSRS